MEGAEVKAWRRAERQRLIALRTACRRPSGGNWGAQIEAALRGMLAERPGILGVYWPFRAEFDPRPLIDWVVAAGRTVALAGRRRQKGAARIPRLAAGRSRSSTASGTSRSRRSATSSRRRSCLAPLVGFDEACYRLGYGGGYFDRTLAALSPRALAIGVGFELPQIETIYPQSFDIPMDLIVTEAGIRERAPEQRAQSPAEARPRPRRPRAAIAPPDPRLRRPPRPRPSSFARLERCSE